MPISFHEFSDRLILERKFDAEIGAAASKSFALFSEMLLETFEAMGNYFISVVEKDFDSDIHKKYAGGSEEGMRQDLYIYSGYYHKLPGGYKNEFDARLFTEHVRRLLLASSRSPMMRSMPGALLIRDSKIIDNKRSTFTLTWRPELMVLPKSIKPESLKALFPNSKPYLDITLHTSENVQSSSTKDFAVGMYNRPSTIYTKKDGDTPAGQYVGSQKKADPNKTFVHSRDLAEIHLSGFKSLEVETVSQLVRILIMDGDKPNLMKSHVRQWIDILKGELRSNESTYVHEYTHFLDNMRMGLTNPKNVAAGIDASWTKGAGDKEWGVYYKSDIEWNAHFQDTAQLLRTALRDFMIAIANLPVAMGAIGMSNFREEGEDFVLKGPYQSTYNTKIADKVWAILRQLLNETYGNSLKKYVQMTGDPNIMGKMTPENKEKYLRLLRLFLKPALSANPAAMFFSVILTEFLNTKHTFTDFMLSDDKFRKKFLARVYSAAEDLVNIYNKGIADIRAGKFPSKQAWNKAVTSFTTIVGPDIAASRRIAMSGIRSTEEWSKPRFIKSAYLNFYSGTFMRTYQPDNGPFDPRKAPIKIPKVFADMSQTIEAI